MSHPFLFSFPCTQANDHGSEDYEAEIQVGLYDQWLRQLDFGPTQADRVLVHTDMMEHAHERRFAVSQASIGLSRFEADHSRRIKQAIDHLQTRFAAHASCEPDDSEECRDEVLIGLARPPCASTQTDCTQFATHPTRRLTSLVQAELYSMLQQTNPGSSKRAHPRTDDMLVADVNERDYCTVQEEVYEELMAARKRLRRTPSKGSLQMRPIRYRSDAIRSAVKKEKVGKHHCLHSPAGKESRSALKHELSFP